MQVALIIEALALEFTLDVSSLAFLSGASGKKKPVIYVPIRHPAGPTLYSVRYPLYAARCLYSCVCSLDTIMNYPSSKRSTLYAIRYTLYAIRCTLYALRASSI